MPPADGPPRVGVPVLGVQVKFSLRWDTEQDWGLRENLKKPGGGLLPRAGPLAPAGDGRGPPRPGTPSTAHAEGTPRQELPWRKQKQRPRHGASIILRWVPHPCPQELPGDPIWPREATGVCTQAQTQVLSLRVSFWDCVKSPPLRPQPCVLPPSGRHPALRTELPSGTAGRVHCCAVALSRGG